MLRLFKHGPRVNAALIVQAEELTEELGALEGFIQAAGWDLDSALSSIRKDEAGYRIGNAANRSGGESYVEGELEEAVKRARAILLACATCAHLLREAGERKALADAIRQPTLAA
jgi:hypothetical protein